MIDPSPTTPESEIGSQGIKNWNKSPTNMKWQGQPEKGQSEIPENIVEKYIFQVFWSEESQCTELFRLVNGLTPIKQIHQKKEAINF